MKKIVLLVASLFFFNNMYAQRNVILIIADDLSSDYFGFYENHVDTVDVPTIRALANRGVRFKHMMSNPVCSSTRTTMLTGRYAFRTGVGYIVGSTAGSGQIDTSEKTIPKLLTTFNSTIGKANIGKWHLNQPMPAINLTYPNVLGYDLFQGPFIGAISSYTNWMKYTNGVSSNVTTYATSENVNDALTWIQTQTGHPFFLWLAFNAPHEPLHLPPASLHTYTSLTGTPADINANPKSYFKAMIQALDHEMGRLFDSLQTMNRLDSTDIIFIGDNGNTSRTAQNLHINQAKGTIYQYGVSVPFIVAGPSVTNPGRVSDALVNSVDVFATVLDLLGDSTWSSQIPIGKQVDSKRMYPILKNTTTQIRPWSFCELFKTTTDSSDGKAIRNLDYKLIRFDNGVEKLFNLTLDPSESNNLLQGALSSTDAFNYNYLCTELTNLVGAGSFCTTGVSTNEFYQAESISIYPNPFSSILKINSSKQIGKIEVRDCVGRIVHEEISNSEIDLSDLNSGIYFITIESESKKIFKVVKE